MSVMGAARILLMALAWSAVLLADRVLPRIREFGRWGPLARLHGRVGRIPELCSRLGWIVSAWMLLYGQGWRALAVYAGTKLVAGSLALWIYSACLPALLRVPAFAAVHASMQGARLWIVARIGHRTGGLAAAMARLRARRVSRS
jgi:hypothetical protein